MSRFRRLLHKRKLESQLDTELQFHLKQQVADYIRSGMTEDEALRKAHLEFGGIEQIKEECRDARGTIWLESSVQDLRLALRVLRKSPIFTFAAIGTLTLGIGANTAIFQLLDAVRLRTLPVADPQALASIHIEGGNGGFGITARLNSLSYAVWEQIREHQRGFSDVFAWTNWGFTLGRGASERSVKGLWFSGPMFSALGISPQAGRFFTTVEDRVGCGDQLQFLAKRIRRSNLRRWPHAPD
jgi:MacB-like periplasmic core domain